MQPTYVLADGREGSVGSRPEPTPTKQKHTKEQWFRNSENTYSLAQQIKAALDNNVPVANTEIATQAVMQVLVNCGVIDDLVFKD